VEVQRRTLRKFIDEFQNFDNIMWEIMNEPGGATSAQVNWHKGMVNYVKSYEQNTYGRKHLVGMTGGWSLGDNMFSSSADFVSPDNASSSYWQSSDSNGGPASYSNKIIILDTDHLWGFTEQSEIDKIRKWTFKTFLRGNNPIYMDNYKDREFVNNGYINSWENPARIAMRNTMEYAAKFKDLAMMVPTESTSHCSTGYCLRNTAELEYIAYQPTAGGSITINLLPGNYTIETLDAKDSSKEASSLDNWNGGNKTFSKPAHVSSDWVLYLTGGVPTSDTVPPAKPEGLRIIE
jgi:hypothetical protein